MNISTNNIITTNSFEFTKKDLSVETPPQKEEVLSIDKYLSTEAKVNTTESKIFQRLEKNRNFAEAQQCNEKDKKFTLSENTNVNSIEINGNPTEIKKETKVIGKKTVGIASCQGHRSSMEDADLAANISIEIKNEQIELDVFGVFDGHGGNQASTYVKANLQKYLKIALEKNNPNGLTDAGIWNALRECFIQLDADYTTGKDGTTATVAIILQDKIWVANVGDSRTILVKNDGIIIQATEDASPGIERYKKTIQKLKGVVIMGRVMGKLAVARSIGDKLIRGYDGATESYHECCISPKPKITCYPLHELKNGYLVLACDGLYSEASSNQVGRAIREMEMDKNDPEMMAARLVYNAICNEPYFFNGLYAEIKRSTDNVSVVVVKL